VFPEHLCFSVPDHFPSIRCHLVDPCQGFSRTPFYLLAAGFLPAFLLPVLLAQQVAVGLYLAVIKLSTETNTAHPFIVPYTIFVNTVLTTLVTTLQILAMVLSSSVNCLFPVGNATSNIRTHVNTMSTLPQCGSTFSASCTLESLS
jgi:hypothetical protein